MISNSGLPRIHLQPGQLHLTRSPAILQTILGSCVGVTFWSKRQNAGAMCHGVLPRCPQKWPLGTPVLDGHRYVDYSIRYLAEQFDAIGAKRREIEVKVFGGADVLLIACAGMRRPSIGALNCEVALEVLCSEGFDVLASDLRGTDGRSIRFHTGTGEVLLRRLTTCKE